jgi:NAD(P)-dependent dehydrogenase (short-subunit alcohol dehydrogenase family)
MNNSKPAALVTGASTGIGRSAAIALSKSGYDVIVNYSRSEDAAKLAARAAEAAGARVLLHRCDVSDETSVRAMLAEVEKAFGRLDVLINNAGTTVDVEPKNFDAMTVEAWNRVYAVAPGWIEGEWMKRTLAENYDGLMARRAKYTPLKRCCTEDDVADSMLSLILYNRFVTGEIIIVDGGFSSTT